MTGLTALSALVAVAFNGSGMASADSLCLVDPGTQNECPAGKIWTGPIIGLTNTQLLTSGAFQSLCLAKFLADYVSNEGAHKGLLYLILSIEIHECVGSCVSAKAENLPYLILASALKEHAILTEHGKGRPAALFEGCSVLGFKINCLYETAPEALLTYLLELKEGQPLVGAFDAIALPLTRGGDSALCPKETTWSAQYLIHEDVENKPAGELFLTALP
jgi:hypothetical protein